MDRTQGRDKAVSDLLNVIQGEDCHEGYGGGGCHTRRDLDDLYAFHIPTSCWFSVATAGTPPAARSGHGALASLSSSSGHDNLFVMGGWSVSQQFDDVHILENDGSTLTWSSMDTASGPDSWGPRRWNFGSISVKAVPNWKIFVFGGNSGDLDQTPPLPKSDDQGKESSDLSKSATGWVRPDLVGSSPCPRSDTPIIYSKDLGKLFLFGGWASRWHDDIFTCDVRDIVGPPYNIFNINAVDWAKATSPITGGVPLAICGQGFAASSGGSSNAQVKFACSKGFIEVSGDLKGDGDIVCTAPEFLKYGPDEPVEVTVKIGPNRFTNNALPFSFFSVTDASQTVAFGPGLLEGIASKRETSFIIQAKDEMSQDRVCGMDEFKIVVRDLVEEPPPLQGAWKHMAQIRDNNAMSIIAASKLKARAMRIRRKLGGEQVTHEMEDCKDGTYLVKFTPPEDGYYQIDISFMGTFRERMGPSAGLHSQCMRHQHHRQMMKQPTT